MIIKLNFDGEEFVGNSDNFYGALGSIIEDLCDEDQDQETQAMVIEALSMAVSIYVDKGKAEYEFGDEGEHFVTIN